MLGEALLDAALWKMQIAPQMVDQHQLVLEIEPFGRFLRLRQQCFGFSIVIENAVAGGETIPGGHPHAVVVGQLQRLAVGVDRGGGLSGILQQLAMEQRKRGPLSCSAREREAHLRQGQRLVIPILRGDGARRRFIGQGSTGIGSQVEMQRPEHGIALFEPFRGGAMQLLPRCGQQRVINPVADQRMGEQEGAGIGADQAVPDQFRRLIIGNADHRAHRLKRKSLADDRRGLQGTLVDRRQAVRARQNQTLDRGGHRRRIALAGVAQELLEEQRIAFGALDAAGDYAIVGDRQTDGQRPRFRPTQRAEVDDRQRPAAGLAPPGSVDGISLDARGQRQDHRRVIGHRCQRR
jgi:hypothetical protein